MKKRTRKHWYMAAGMAAAISFCMSGCGHKTETEQRLEKSSVTAETEADGIEQQETEKDTQAQKKERPKTPYGVKISDISDAGIEVYWKGNEPWYEIYRSYEEDGTYELIADTGQIRKTPQKSSHGTYYDTEFDESRRTVYYKVRCYQYDEQKEKVYSKFSKVMTANYREQMKLNLSRMYVPSDVTRSLIAYYGWGNVQDAVWKSDAPQIAEVDADGNVTGISAGSCNITCSSESIQTELSCHIVVDRAPEPPLKEIDAEYEQISPGYWEKKNPDKTDEALIMLVGDLMCTSAQQRVDIDENGSYNFNESFTYVKDIISSADFATGNLETLLSSSWPYMKEEVYVDGKPNCNAPARYLDALIDAGFDAVMMANNHNADGGVRGTIETAQVVDQYQLMRAGSFASAEDPRTLLVDINGIKTGFLSYSPSYPGYNAKDVNWTQEEKDTYLN